MGVYTCSRRDGQAVVHRDGTPFDPRDWFDHDNPPLLCWDWGRQTPGALLLAYAVLRNATSPDEALFRLYQFASGPIARLPLDRAAFTDEGVSSWLVKAEQEYPFRPFQSVQYVQRFALNLGINARPKPGGGADAR